MKQKKIYAGIAAGVVIVIAAMIYFMNGNRGNDYVDFADAKKSTCELDGRQNLLMVYAQGENTGIAVVDDQSFEVISTCELPFENNENIYIEQDANQDLYVSNGVDELFKYNGSHFLKVPFQTYTTGTDVRVHDVNGKSQIDLKAGSAAIVKEFTYTSGYTLKNAYIYSRIQEENTLNLFQLQDPGASIQNNYIVMRIRFNDTIYYAFFDEDTRELLRCIADPFETTEGGFASMFEGETPLLFVGGQVYDINAGSMIAHDAVTIDEAQVSVEAIINMGDGDLRSTGIKGTDGEVHNYIIQGNITIEFAYLVQK